MEKQKVIDQCRRAIRTQLSQLEQQLGSIREARDQETKSSVGDKYETGRAMMQSEEARIMSQYEHNQVLLKELEVVSKSNPTELVRKGSLVQTREHWYYLAIPLGKITLEAGHCYVISTSAPLGSQLLGKAKGDRFSFRGRQIEIMNIL